MAGTHEMQVVIQAEGTHDITQVKNTSTCRWLEERRARRGPTRVRPTWETGSSTASIPSQRGARENRRDKRKTSMEIHFH